jgi:hypothetical protein
VALLRLSTSSAIAHHIAHQDGNSGIPFATVITLVTLSARTQMTSSSQILARVALTKCACRIASRDLAKETVFSVLNELFLGLSRNFSSTDPTAAEACTQIGAVLYNGFDSCSQDGELRDLWLQSVLEPLTTAINFPHGAELVCRICVSLFREMPSKTATAASAESLPVLPSPVIVDFFGHSLRTVLLRYPHDPASEVPHVTVPLEPHSALDALHNLCARACTPTSQGASVQGVVHGLLTSLLLPRILPCVAREMSQGGGQQADNNLAATQVPCAYDEIFILKFLNLLKCVGTQCPKSFNCEGDPASVPWVMDQLYRIIRSVLCSANQSYRGECTTLALFFLPTFLAWSRSPSCLQSSAQQFLQQQCTDFIGTLLFSLTRVLPSYRLDEVASILSQVAREPAVSPAGFLAFLKTSAGEGRRADTFLDGVKAALQNDGGRCIFNFLKHNCSHHHCPYFHFNSFLLPPPTVDKQGCPFCGKG